MRRLYILLIVLLLPLNVTAQDREGQADQAEGESGKLEDFGKEAERINKPNESERSQQEEERDRESDDATTDLIVDILQAIFESGISVRPDTSSLPDEYHTFSQYPYAEPGHGLYKIGGAKDLSINLKANYYRESPDLMGGGARLRFSPYRYFSAEAYMTLLSEQLKTRTDRIMLSSFFLNYHLVRENAWTMWIGLGSKGVHGAGASEDGLSGSATVEVYPVDPISFHANFSWGTYSELFATLNYHLNRYTLSLGYQSVIAGKAGLHGLLAGTSVYF